MIIDQFRARSRTESSVYCSAVSTTVDMIQPLRVLVPASVLAILDPTVARGHLSCPCDTVGLSSLAGVRRADGGAADCDAGNDACTAQTD